MEMVDILTQKGNNWFGKHYTESHGGNEAHLMKYINLCWSNLIGIS